MTHQSASQVVREFLEGPLTRPALLLWRRKQFLSREGHGFYFGLFDSFEAARAWLPKNPEFGQDALATEYVDVRTKKVFAYDYPVMWWLEHAMREGATRVLDIGGSVGVHYYAYRRYIDMPAALRWHIVEVPIMISIGRKLAADTGASALDFTADLQRAVTDESADVWISAGAIHYMDATPGPLLKKCKTRPRHVILNKLPLYEGESFITTQNIGAGSFAPMHVYNRGRFVRDIEAMGYTLRDEWPVHERSLYLPGHPERSFPSFTGLYFSDRSLAGRSKRAGELHGAGSTQQLKVEDPEDARCEGVSVGDRLAAPPNHVRSRPRKAGPITQQDELGRKHLPTSNASQISSGEHRLAVSVRGGLPILATSPPSSRGST